MMIDEKYNILIKEVREISGNILDMDNSNEKDHQVFRADIQDIKVKMATISEQLEQLRKAINNNADKVEDKVNDVMEPAVKEIRSFKDVIKKKKFISIKRGGLFTWFGRRFEKRNAEKS